MPENKSDNFPAVPSRWTAIWRMARGIGPLALSLFDKGSEKLANHELRMAQVEAVRTLMLGDAQALTEVRRKLRERYYDASDEERVRIRRDLEHVEKDSRQLGVYQKAIEYVPVHSEAEDNTEPSQQFVAWLDTFNDYARRINEPWRGDLLARALALESVNPGCIGQRALWFVGTMDEKSFHAFASVLDLCSRIGGGLVVPEMKTILEKALPNCALGPTFTLSQALFELGELGLVGDVMTSTKSGRKGALFVAEYGDRRVTMIAREQIEIGGVLPTTLGHIIAKLYEGKPNDVGREAFEAWFNNVKPQVDILPDADGREEA